jgi:quinol monooxygenase YgiN
VSNQVHLNVALSINEGKFDAFQKTAQAMTAGTDQEKGAVTYHWYLSPDRKSCRLIETYRDADALLAHFKGEVVQKLVPQLLESTSLVNFEVCGQPDPEAAKMLTSMNAKMFSFWKGINR